MVPGIRSRFDGSVGLHIHETAFWQFSVQSYFPFHLHMWTHQVENRRWALLNMGNCLNSTKKSGIVASDKYLKFFWNVSFWNLLKHLLHLIISIFRGVNFDSVPNSGFLMIHSHVCVPNLIILWHCNRNFYSIYMYTDNRVCVSVLLNYYYSLIQCSSLQ